MDETIVAQGYYFRKYGIQGLSSILSLMEMFAFDDEETFLLFYLFYISRKLYYYW